MIKLILTSREFLVWIILLVLTTASYLLGVSQSLWILLALLFTFIKGYLVINYYMELQNAPFIWKYAVSGYLTFVIGVISLVIGWS